MKQEKIKSIIHQQVNEIADLCGRIGEDFDKEAIHKFRVAVKGLRSFLRLQKMHTGDPKIKLLKKFKRLYDIAGVIREAQLEIEFLEKSKQALPHYLAQLQQTILNMQNEWERRYSKKILEKLDDKLAGFKYKKLHPAVLEHFFNARIAAISNIAQTTGPTDTEIHEARKNIKDVLYTSKIAGKKWKAAKKKLDQVPVKKLDALATIIGDYNDERIILEHLTAFASGGAGEGEKSKIGALKGKESKQLRKKKSSIIHAAGDLLNSQKSDES